MIPPAADTDKINPTENKYTGLIASTARAAMLTEFKRSYCTPLNFIAIMTSHIMSARTEDGEKLHTLA